MKKLEINHCFGQKTSKDLVFNLYQKSGAQIFWKFMTHISFGVLYTTHSPELCSLHVFIHKTYNKNTESFNILTLVFKTLTICWLCLYQNFILSQNICTQKYILKKLENQLFLPKNIKITYQIKKIKHSPPWTYISLYTRYQSIRVPVKIEQNNVHNSSSWTKFHGKRCTCLSVKKEKTRSRELPTDRQTNKNWDKVRFGFSIV